MLSFCRLLGFFFVLATLTGGNALAQTTDILSQEIRVVKLYSKLYSFGRADADSISFYSDKFEKEFTSIVKNNPASLSYPFKRLVDSNFCDVKTSNDGNFRIYSWDTWTGGTMHFFRAIYQWKAKGEVFMKVPKHEELDAGSFCSKIFTVNINDKPYYLTITNGIFSTKDAMQSISTFNIEGDKLIDTVKIFKTRTKKLNSIDVRFDFFSVADRPERPLELITYDDKRKIIYIPVVDDQGQVTKTNILYQLKNNYFEFIGTKTGMRK